MTARNGGEIHFQPMHEAQAAVVAGFTGRDIIRAGRRWGKTTALEECAAWWALNGLKVGWFSPSYKLLLPSYKRILKRLRPQVEHSSKVDTLIELTNGGEVEFWTLSDEDAGRSRSYDWVIIDEASLVSKGLREIWEKSISPTLLDRGGSCVMAGTPKGIDPDNFFWWACRDEQSPFKEWYAPTANNPTLDAEEVANLQNEYPPLVYQQEFLAEFVDWAGAAFFSEPSLLENGLPVAYPLRCDSVFAILDTAVKTGKENDGTAVSFWALSNHVGHPLVLLDWSITQIEGSLLEAWLPSVFARLEELAQMVNPRNGSIGVFIEDAASGQILLQQGRRRGWNVHAIDSDLTAAGKDERAISVSGYVYRGLVKMSAFAYNKVENYKGQIRNHFKSQVCGFRIGVKNQDDDLLDTFTYAIAIALGDAYGH